MTRRCVMKNDRRHKDMKYRELMDLLEQIAPTEYYEDEDNSGIQVHDGKEEVNRVLVCLEMNDAVLEEAAEKKADMIITHHPLIFYPISSVGSDDVPGRYIIRLVENGISVYSSHLPFDFCETGNNAYLAKLLGLVDADTPKGEQVLIFGEGVKFNHTAYFLAENNDKTLGIKILGTSDKGIYAFPGDIIYPNPKTEYPNRISIFYSPSAQEDFIQLDLQQDYELITEISGAVYDNAVYEMLPESIIENSDITEISIRLFWDNYPYYFEQILTKNTDNQFKITNQETVS